MKIANCIKDYLFEDDKLVFVLITETNAHLNSSTFTLTEQIEVVYGPGVNCRGIQISADGSEIFTYIADSYHLEASSPIIMSLSETGTYTKILPNFFNAANRL